jgi:hypothetical protein
MITWIILVALLVLAGRLVLWRGYLGLAWLLPLLLLVSVGTAPAQTIRPKQVLIPDGTGSVLKAPKMTTAQRDASSHVDGEIIDCSDCAPAGVYFYFAGAWHASGTGAGAGTVTNTLGNLTLNQLMLGNGGADATVLGSLGSATTVLHGGAGAPTFGSVVSADLNLTATTCTNQVVTALSAAAAGTCASVTNSMLAGSIAASKLVGTDIATVGTITSGTWNGTAIAANHGGTGQTSYAAKGDLLVSSGTTTLTKLTVGSNTQVLTADSTQATGVKWSAAGSGTVTASGSPSVHHLAVFTTATDVTGLAPGATGTYLRSVSASDPIWSTVTLPNAFTVGDLLAATSTNVGGVIADVAVGNVLLSGGVGALPFYGTVDLAAHVGASILPVANGGSGAATFTVHGVLVGNTASPFGVTTAGATGTVLAGATGADPAFTATPALTSVTTSGQGALVVGPYGVGVGNTGELRFLELAANGSNYVGFKAADTLGGNLIWKLPTVDGANGECLATDGAGTLSWGACSAGSGTGITSLNGLNGAVQTFADDTNVTMVSAGTTHTITWASTLSVPRGGLGAGTHTDHGVLLGAGTSAVTATAEGVTGTVLQGSTGNPPAFTATPTVTSVTTTGQAALSAGPYGVGAGNTGEVRFLELAANGTDSVGFKAPNSIASSVIWTLPTADGTNGQCWVTNGSGVLSFGACATNQAPADAQYLTLALNGTLTNERALTAGANISFADAGANSTLTVTAVPSGSTTQVQYNASGAFAASANLTFDGTDLTLGRNILLAGATMDSTTANGNPRWIVTEPGGHAQYGPTTDPTARHPYMTLLLNNLSNANKTGIYCENVTSDSFANNCLVSYHFSQKDVGADASGITGIEMGNGNAGTFIKFVQNRTAGLPTLVDATSRQYGFALEVFGEGDSTSVFTGSDSGIGLAAGVGEVVGPPWAEGVLIYPRTNASNLASRIALRVTQNQDNLVSTSNDAFRLMMNGTLFLPTIPAVSGTRFLCISTTGQITSSASACSGT